MAGNLVAEASSWTAEASTWRSRQGLAFQRRATHPATWGVAMLVPLMVIVFLPAVEGLRPQWREATENLGGTTWTYWTRVAGPILLPSLLGSFLLLFANAFSAFATAAALISQQSVIVPLEIESALRNENDLGMDAYAQALAFGMIVVVALVMGAYALLMKRAARWSQ